MRSTTIASPSRLWVGSLAGAEDFEAANDLYRRVFDYDSESFSLNPYLLAAIARNGGSAVGVKDSGRLVGFAYGFPGTDGSHLFHYSQAAVVDQDYQGLGIGRRLKEAQREVALASGATHMRWSFNPLYSRNGHFNFATLGAVGAAFVPDYYGRPLTDRLIADWDLRQPSRTRISPATVASEIRHAASPERWGEVLEGPDALYVVIPARVNAGERHRELDGVRLKLRGALERVFAADRVLSACERLSAETSVYVAVARAGD